MAALVDSATAVSVPAPLLAAEQAGSSTVGVAPSAEGRVSPVEVIVTTPSQDQSGAAMVVLEGVVLSAPSGPVALEAAPMEEDPIGGSSGIVVVVRRTRRESPPAPLSGGSRSPAWGEPPLQWMDAQDPMSALFMLDDHSESMEQESLDFGLSTMMNDLDQVRGALREIVVPTSQVSACSSLFSSFKYFCVFVFLILVFFSGHCCS